MTLLACTVAYLVLHFVLYVVALRNLPAFGTERVIFLYHAVPALVLVLVTVVTVAIAQDPTTFAFGVLAISLQGLYSLSFLELWALSDGGYSLQILEHLANSPGAFDASGMKEVGASKRSDRLQSAIDLRLVETDGKTFALTRVGRPIAGVFATILWITNAKLD
jgi:hypothetical protein